MVALESLTADEVAARLVAELGEPFPLRSGPMWMRSGPEHAEIVVTLCEREPGAPVQATLMDSRPDHAVRLSTFVASRPEELEALMSAVGEALGRGADGRILRGGTAGRGASAQRDRSSRLRVEVHRLLAESRSLLEQGRELVRRARGIRSRS